MNRRSPALLCVVRGTGIQVRTVCATVSNYTIGLYNMMPGWSRLIQNVWALAVVCFPSSTPIARHMLPEYSLACPAVLAPTSWTPAHTGLGARDACIALIDNAQLALLRNPAAGRSQAVRRCNYKLLQKRCTEVLYNVMLHMYVIYAVGGDGTAGAGASGGTRPYHRGPPARHCTPMNVCTDHSDRLCFTEKSRESRNTHESGKDPHACSWGTSTGAAITGPSVFHLQAPAGAGAWLLTQCPKRLRVHACTGMPLER